MNAVMNELDAHPENFHAHDRLDIADIEARPQTEQDIVATMAGVDRQKSPDHAPGHFGGVVVARLATSDRLPILMMNAVNGQVLMLEKAHHRNPEGETRAHLDEKSAAARWSAMMDEPSAERMLYHHLRRTLRLQHRLTAERRTRRLHRRSSYLNERTKTVEVDIF